MERQSVGLVAGNGILPQLFIESAKKQGLAVYVVGHIGETSSDLQLYADGFIWVRVGQVGSILKFMKRHGVTKLAFAGGIKRPKLLGGVRLDVVGMRIVARARSVRDDAILTEIAKEFARHGISVVAPTEFLSECLAQKGCLTKRILSSQQHKDALLGWEVAKRLGELDVGQAVIVYDGIVVALEGIEGTDAMIARAGDLTNHKGGVLVKVSKPQQDLRLDLPTVGEDTIKNLSRAGLLGVVLESEKTIILNPFRLVASANQEGLAVEVW
jgi:UDP-2,3-diacylglucosamine hydrolase